MPRKRTIADEDLLAAALLIVRESGPDALTFAALSARVGLAGSTIVQRFGTKAGLLRAALSQAWDRLDADTEAAAAVPGDGAPAVVDMLVRLSGQYDPQHYADELLILREDLRDPVLRARGRAWLATLTEAIEQRLAGTPGAAGLGGLAITHWQGALTVWGFRQDARLDRAVRAALEDLFSRLAV